MPSSQCRMERVYLQLQQSSACQNLHFMARYLACESALVLVLLYTVLQQSDEQEIVLTCQVLADMVFGATRKLVETVVADYIRENGIQTPFVNGIPGKDWWQ